MKIKLFILPLLFLESCQNAYQESLFVDNNTTFASNTQIVPSQERGEFGVHYLSANTDDYERKYYIDSFYKKSFITTNWGMPDEVEQRNGIEYLIYFRGKSKNIESDISMYGKKHVKLGYKNNDLVYIEGVVANAMEHSGKVRVVFSN